MAGMWKSIKSEIKAMFWRFTEGPDQAELMYYSARYRTQCVREGRYIPLEEYLHENNER